MASFLNASPPGSLERPAGCITMTLATSGTWTWTIEDGESSNGPHDLIDELTVSVPSSASAAVRVAGSAAAVTAGHYFDVAPGQVVDLPGQWTQLHLVNLDGSNTVDVGVAVAWKGYTGDAQDRTKFNWL